MSEINEYEGLLIWYWTEKTECRE